MAMQTVKDLFQHELGDMYDAEQRIVQILPQLANECNNGQVKSAFQHHEQETRQQIKNIEQCFQAIGASPQQVTCTAISGLKQEHDTFLKEQPSKDILTMFDLGAAAKTEHYEIAAYRGLIEKASLMGQKECVRLLQENLNQEEDMAQKVEQISRQFGKQASQQQAGQPV